MRISISQPEPQPAPAEPPRLRLYMDGKRVPYGAEVEALVLIAAELIHRADGVMVCTLPDGSVRAIEIKAEAR